MLFSLYDVITDILGPGHLKRALIPTPAHVLNGHASFVILHYVKPYRVAAKHKLVQIKSFAK